MFYSCYNGAAKNVYQQTELARLLLEQLSITTLFFYILKVLKSGFDRF